MKNHRQPARTGLLVVLSLCTVIALSPLSSATGNILKSDLKGTWRIALRGNTGCGFSAMLATVNMGTTGSGTGTLQTHGACGDSTLSGQTFTVNTLATNGKGTAGLTCGVGCGWTFKLQVSPDRSKFSLADVAPTNPNNFLEGTGVLASTAGDIVTSDLTGGWQVTLYSFGGCGIASNLVTFTLNSSGVTNNATNTGHSAGCGDGTTTGNTFSINSLNSDGSGTAGLSCGVGCGFTFNIQVAPDRSSFNLVDVASTNPNNFLAGVAMRNSSAGNIVTTNLAGPWQLALDGVTGCGNTSMSVTFTLSALGVAVNAAETGHSAGCGDSTTTGNTFTVTSLNADGSGTAGLTCGTGCGWTFNIQASPDRSTFNVVDVAAINPNNYLAGEAVHQ
jgi:hypothetical protein